MEYQNKVPLWVYMLIFLEILGLFGIFMFGVLCFWNPKIGFAGLIISVIVSLTSKIATDRYIRSLG